MHERCGDEQTIEHDFPYLAVGFFCIFHILELVVVLLSNQPRHIFDLDVVSYDNGRGPEIDRTTEDDERRKWDVHKPAMVS